MTVSPPAGSVLARFVVLVCGLLPGLAVAGVGDPQVATDHPWYPGELAVSTFPRLQETQAEQYERATGVRVATDEQKALAAWLWRNTHYWHGEEGGADLWGRGFTAGGDLRGREYWTGLFAHGFGLCGTTHSQWTAEMEMLLGHGRGRGVGVAGHNAFEVYLTGGAYGEGRWALLDHDLSTVIYDEAGERLLSIPEIGRDLDRLTDRGHRPEKQHGWLVCGLHPGDGAVYESFQTAEYLAGYAGPPPMARLRRGETLRRYLAPGLEDGTTFVFWGRNDKTGGVPGPERSQTWAGQPDAMHGSRGGAGYKPGQARFANAVYHYTPDFANGDYREGVREEAADHVTFTFATPYVIAATPADDSTWGIYKPGGRNGLVLTGSFAGRAACPVALSTDGGATWQECGALTDGLDLTDRVKGRRQYLIRFGAGAEALAGSGLTMTTVCQANAFVMPHLTDDGCEVAFLASGRAVASAGPEVPLAGTHVVEGAFGSPRVTLELAPPGGGAAVTVFAAAHVNSSNPPDPAVKYQIEASTDGGTSWRPVVKDWTIPRRGEEPPDFWSQSLCWGSADLPAGTTGPVRVRFRNDGGKSYARAEMHLVHTVPNQDATEVTFAWTDDAGPQQASHAFEPADGPEAQPATWTVPTGTNVQTRWIEFRPTGP